MGLFDKLTKKTGLASSSSRASTFGFCIGVPEAEAEATNASIKLETFFDDYLDVVGQLNDEKFIVLGRKGTGKSAIGEHILFLSKNEPNYFCAFIKKDEIDIEKIVQIGKEEGVTIERDMLYKWIILTKFISLFVDNQSLEYVGKKYLSDFINKNRGFININNFEVKEIIHQYGVNVNVEYFRRFLSASGNANANKQFKLEKAEFFKLIPELEKVVTNILKGDKDNKYILMFDDLDLGLNLNNQDSKEILSGLIRTIKYYNNEVFARNSIDSKIIIFLRTDIQKHLIYSADMPKIFSSYSAELKWYEDFYRNDELKLRIRQFINKRIQVNFQKKNYKINNLNDPWTSFIDEKDFYGDKTGFKYILDHTFFRPRDLILFFKDIGTLDLDLPLSYKVVSKTLMQRYASNMVQDIKGELSIIYNQKEIDCIFASLRNCFSCQTQFTESQLSASLKNCGLVETDRIIADLFDYSLIGNLDNKGNVGFKFREASGQIVECDFNSSFVLHYVIQSYFKTNKFSTK